MPHAPGGLHVRPPLEPQGCRATARHPARVCVGTGEPARARRFRNRHTVQVERSSRENDPSEGFEWHSHGKTGSRGEGLSGAEADEKASAEAIAAPSRARFMVRAETDLMAYFPAATPDAFSSRATEGPFRHRAWAVYILLSYCPTLVVKISQHLFSGFLLRTGHFPLALLAASLRQDPHGGAKMGCE